MNKEIIYLELLAFYLLNYSMRKNLSISRFLMRLTKDDSEVNLASGETDPEFSEWKWANPEEVIEQVCCGGPS